MERKEIKSDFLSGMPMGWEFLPAAASGLSCDSYELSNTPYFIEIRGEEYSLSSFSGVSFEKHEVFLDLEKAMRHGERLAFTTMGETGMDRQE